MARKKLKPIPKKLLIHDITFQKFEGDTPFGKQFAPIETMEMVRIEPAFKIRRDFDGVSVDVKSILFIDCVNTINNVELPTQSTVIWDGVELKVVECQLYYGFDGVTPHHYEVMLV